MRITDLHATAISIPRSHTLATSYGSRDTAITILVELETSEGVSGYGQSVIEAPFYGETMEGTLADIRAHLAPVVIGRSPDELHALKLAMERSLPDHPIAQTAVELALWDLLGKHLGVPIYQLLGGKVRDGVHLMGSVATDTPVKMAQEARTIVEAFGYRHLKLKIGIDPDTDLAAFRAVAQAVAGKARIQVDGNAGYSLADAQLVLSEMHRTGGLGVIEQPVRGLVQLETLARSLPVPVMVDESLTGEQDAIDVVRGGIISLAFLKISRCGGLLNAWRVATILNAAGIQVAVGIYYDLLAAAACHLAASTPGLDWPAPMTSLEGTILATPVQPFGLVLPAPDAPGLGVTINHDLVRRYALDV